jgi:hypothetical protein
MIIITRDGAIIQEHLGADTGSQEMKPPETFFVILLMVRDATLFETISVMTRQLIEAIVNHTLK